MITSQEILAFMRDTSYRPLAYKDLLNALTIPIEAEGEFSKVLGQMEKNGDIVRTRKDKYGLPEMMNLVKGYIKLGARGFGIVVTEDPQMPEIFVYGRNLNGAMHEDRVMVRIMKRFTGQERPEGEVIRTISRANTELVGTFSKERNFAQVIPDDSRQIYPINVKPTSHLKVKNGDKVLVKITAWPTKNLYPEGEIIAVFGRRGEPGVDLQIVIKSHQLRTDFPHAVIKEALEVSSQPITAADIAGRKDLRDLPMVTIDGEDAKDLDDAVSIEKIAGGYRLGVHIADVSHYVTEDSELDREAFARATSVYLIDTVLPMLPRELSNDICSLNAGQDRLALSCIMDIDKNGKVFNYEITKSIIHVGERMTYTRVNEILGAIHDKTSPQEQADSADFYLMKELADIIRNERVQRGALDFDFPEAKVIVDEKSFPIEIQRFERGPAEMIIEDFMIKANEVVAEHLFWQELPALYRVHEKPDSDALEKLNNVLGAFGFKIRTQKLESRLYQKILREIKGNAAENTIALMVLRSMKHARYLPQALGHFGLGSKYYAHFTSPIRRYPDLIIHRVLSKMLAGKISTPERIRLEKKMSLYAEQSSLQERRAEEAERDLVDMKKAQYMQKFIGQQFTAIISSVQTFGFFVELPNTVEGLVHISSITDDYYEFNDRAYTLTGRHGGRVFRIGDPVQVQLVRVDIDEAKIDFELIY